VTGDSPWNGSPALFYWAPWDRGGRVVSFVGRGRLDGLIDGPASASYKISSATAYPWDKNVAWNTPDLPGVRPGDQGGPLYLNFDSGLFGADVYIHGYLYKCRLPHGQGCDHNPVRGPRAGDRRG
jgi:hypothetical protein